MQTRSTEEDRRREEAHRNDARFDTYNARRVAAGLPPLSWTDYCLRKHGLDRAINQVCQLAAAETRPEHRDNVALFRR